MAIKTQLSLTATPGRRYSFSAKTEAPAVEEAEWQNIIFEGVDAVSGNFIHIVGRYIERT